MPVGYLGMPSAFQRREQYEQVGGAIAGVIIIVSRGMPWLGRDWHARFGHELLRRLIQADHRDYRIIRSLIDLQHILHGRDEGGVAVRSDDPLLFQMRLERVFLSVRPIVLSLA